MTVISTSPDSHTALLQNHRYILGNPFFQLMRLDVQASQFLVKFSQPFREVKRICLPIRNPNISPWVETPPLRLDFRNRSHLAETGNVNVLSIREMVLPSIPRCRAGFPGFAPIQPRMLDRNSICCGVNSDGPDRPAGKYDGHR